MNGEELARNYAGNKGKLLGEYRESFIILWLARFRFCSQEVLSIALSNQEGAFSVKASKAKLEKMTKKQLIKRCDCIYSKHGYIYMLTKAGLDRANYLSKRDFPNRLDSSKLRQNQSVPHSLGVQACLAYFIAKYDIMEFETEYELSKTHKSLPVRPDAVIVFGNGSRHAIEFEPTPKSAKRVMGHYFDLRVSQDKSTVGILDKHHQAMLKNLDNSSTYWEKIHYVMVNGVDSYKKYVEDYYRRRNSESSRQGWIDSYVFKRHIAKIVTDAVYNKQLVDDKLANIY